MDRLSLTSVWSLACGVVFGIDDGFFERLKIDNFRDERSFCSSRSSAGSFRMEATESGLSETATEVNDGTDEGRVS
jgi:hypothetical protein